MQYQEPPPKRRRGLPTPEVLEKDRLLKLQLMKPLKLIREIDMGSKFIDGYMKRMKRPSAMPWKLSKMPWNRCNPETNLRQYSEGLLGFVLCIKTRTPGTPKKGILVYVLQLSNPLMTIPTMIFRCPPTGSSILKTRDVSTCGGRRLQMLLKRPTLHKLVTRRICWKIPKDTQQGSSLPKDISDTICSYLDVWWTVLKFRGSGRMGESTTTEVFTGMKINTALYSAKQWLKECCE